MYAIVRTGGKQYRVEQGSSLLVERLPGETGAKVRLEPLLYVDGATVIDGDDLGKVQVEAKVLAHERGKKLRVVKFKPKRGYKRRTGHRQELTRLEVTSITAGATRERSRGAEGPARRSGRGAEGPAGGSGRGAEGPARRSGRGAEGPEKERGGDGA